MLTEFRRSTAILCVAVLLLTVLTLSPATLAFVVLIPLAFLAAAVHSFLLPVVLLGRPPQQLIFAVFSPRPPPVR